MKISITAALAIAGALVVSSCSLFQKDADDLGGSTDVSFAAPGNVIEIGTVYADGAALPIEASIEVLTNNDGKGTVKVAFDLEEARANSDVGTLADYLLDSIIPDHETNGSGIVSAEVDFKATSEGIVDYLFGEPFVVIKYADKVGTRYTAENPQGVEMTREIVEKSTDDDFYFGFMLIKVTKIEEPINEGGIRKMTYYANHKFGLVYWEATLDDGSTIGSYLWSAN